jgi:hypothetical protein
MDRGDIRDPNRSRRVAGQPGGVGNIVLIENQQYTENASAELASRFGLQFLSTAFAERFLLLPPPVGRAGVSILAGEKNQKNACG